MGVFSPPDGKRKYASAADEVYSVSAYILAEANIIDKTTVLDAQSLPSVQMPNREGFIPDPRPELFK